MGALQMTVYTYTYILIPVGHISNNMHYCTIDCNISAFVISALKSITYINFFNILIHPLKIFSMYHSVLSKLKLSLERSGLHYSGLLVSHKIT